MKLSSAQDFNFASKSSLTTYLAISAVKTASGRGILAKKICNSSKTLEPAVGFFVKIYLNFSTKILKLCI
jgi:hypothetical protein